MTFEFETPHDIRKRVALLEDGEDHFHDPGHFDDLAHLRREPDEPTAIEDGKYPMRVTGFDETDDFIYFYFEILTGYWAGMEVYGEVESDLSRESEARDWIETILRRPLEDAERVDFDLYELVGERCEAKVTTSFDSPSVVDVYHASPEDPELRELLMQEEIGRFDPLYPGAGEQSSRLYNEAEEMLARLKADRARKVAE